MPWQYSDPRNPERDSRYGSKGLGPTFMDGGPLICAVRIIDSLPRKYLTPYLGGSIEGVGQGRLGVLITSGEAYTLTGKPCGQGTAEVHVLRCLGLYSSHSSRSALGFVASKPSIPWLGITPCHAEKKRGKPDMCSSNWALLP